MRLDTFFEKFELFADAPNAVAKMRELVLRLAFSGGLSDDAAKQDGLPVEWKQKTIESICSSITPGFACSRSHQVENGHVHLRTHNISTLGTLNFDLLVRIDPKMVDAQKASIQKGDILFNNTNSQELVGKTCLVDQDYDYGFSNHITRLRLKEDVFPGFVVFYLTFLRNSGYFAQLCTRWINQAAVNTETLKKETIPLPPFAEQKRIVAKVDELMALCDRLEAQQQERDTHYAALARASLARFTEEPTPANLDFLFHKSYPIAPADLRKTILTLAIMGQLSTQQSDDEPAHELLARIRIELMRISNERGLRIRKATALDETGMPFPIPGGWAWTQLSEIGFINPRNDAGDDLSASFVPMALISENYGVANRHDVRRWGEIKSGYTHFAEGDVSLAKITPCFENGKSTVFRGLTGQIGAGTTELHVVRPVLVDAEYVLIFLKSAYFIESGIPKMTGTAGQKRVPTEYFADSAFPLPPLAEQRRIVAKVDQLMALVDQLEAQLSEAKAKSAALLGAVVYELLNPTAEVIDLASYRAAVGCYAIRKMEGKRYFGRTAAMKVFYLAQAHVGLELGLKPLRDAAGPLDQWIYDFEKEGGRKAWFKVAEGTTASGNKKIEYKSGRMLAEQTAQAERLLSPSQRKEFDRLLSLFADRTTEEVEIIATLFAAWNDFLIDGHAPSDDQIVTEVRENWHERKGRFTPTRLQQWLGWLRQNNLVPQGRLPHTMHQPRLSLN